MFFEQAQKQREIKHNRLPKDSEQDLISHKNTIVKK
jgi:hypothetical protein